MTSLEQAKADFARATERLHDDIQDWQPPTDDPDLAARRLDAINELGRQLTSTEALNLAQGLPYSFKAPAAPRAATVPDMRTPEQKFAADAAEALT